MPRLTARDFAPELLELYDGYAHGKINRREFLDRAALFTFGGLTASRTRISGYSGTSSGM